MFNRQINTVEILDKASLKHERIAWQIGFDDELDAWEARRHYATSEELRLMADRLDVFINPS